MIREGHGPPVHPSTRPPIMRLTIVSLSLLASLALPAAGQTRQTDDSFKWTGSIRAGDWIHVDNLNGNVTVGPASGSEVQVTAVKRWRRGDPAIVRIEAKKVGDNLVVCALWGERSTCDERGVHYNQNRGDRRQNRLAIEHGTRLQRDPPRARGFANRLGKSEGVV